MKKDVIICIGTVGRPTFKKCYEKVMELKRRDPRVKKVVVIKDHPNQASWLNQMRKECTGYTWCLQVDEDMYLKPDCLSKLINLAREKESKGHLILNASGMLHDIFLGQKIGSIKLWRSSALKRYEFRDVMGSDRDLFNRAKKAGYSNVSTHEVLGEHDSAPNSEIAFSKYREYVRKIYKFQNLEKAIAFVKSMEKMCLYHVKDKIALSAFKGASKGLSECSEGLLDLYEKKHTYAFPSKTNSVTSITPTLFFKLKNGNLSRDLDRLSAHLRSIKSQKGVTVEAIVVDQTKDLVTAKNIARICRKNGAIYRHVKTSLIFNKPLMINIGAEIASSEHIAILELDMVFRSDVFKMCLDKVNLGASMVNTTVFYSDVVGPFLDPNFDFSSSFNKYSKNGRINPPGENHQGTQGGIQFCRREFFINELKGVNTDINLFGGPDNDTVRRADSHFAGVVNVCEEDSEILAYHIPHEKIRDFGLVDKEIVREVRRFNQYCAYKMNPKKFISDEKEVLGLRIEDGKIFYGNKKYRISAGNINSSNIHKISDHRKERFRV